jgi:hypothetical protein
MFEVYELDVSLLFLRFLILLTLFVQDGWNRLDLGFYTSSISENRFTTSYQHRLLQNILGKLTVVPVGDTGTIAHHLHNLFPATTSQVPAMDAICGFQLLGIGMVT